jgi:hypothetical protein
MTEFLNIAGGRTACDISRPPMPSLAARTARAEGRLL